jgi:hypothetical protein
VRISEAIEESSNKEVALTQYFPVNSLSGVGRTRLLAQREYVIILPSEKRAHRVEVD